MPLGTSAEASRIGMDVKAEILQIDTIYTYTHTHTCRRPVDNGARWSPVLPRAVFAPHQRHKAPELRRGRRAAAVEPAWRRCRVGVEEGRRRRRAARGAAASAPALLRGARIGQLEEEANGGAIAGRPREAVVVPTGPEEEHDACRCGSARGPKTPPIRHPRTRRRRKRRHTFSTSGQSASNGRLLRKGRSWARDSPHPSKSSPSQSPAAPAAPAFHGDANGRPSVRKGARGRLVRATPSAMAEGRAVGRRLAGGGRPSMPPHGNDPARARRSSGQVPRRPRCRRTGCRARSPRLQKSGASHTPPGPMRAQQARRPR